MNTVIDQPRDDVSKYAPKVAMIRIDPLKIKEVMPGERLLRK